MYNSAKIKKPNPWDVYNHYIKIPWDSLEVRVFTPTDTVYDLGKTYHIKGQTTVHVKDWDGNWVQVKEFNMSKTS